MKNKKWFFVGALALVFIGGLIWFDASGGFDDRSEEIVDLPEETPSVVSNNDISVFTPGANDPVASPLIVKGVAQAFEGTVQIAIRNATGTVVGSSFATAQQSDLGIPGPFLRTVEFDASPGDNLTLEVYEESAQSGLPINMVKVPLVVAQEQLPLLVFFAPKEGHCIKVQEFERSVPHTLGVGTSALELLFAGPTQMEREQGAYTAMPFGVKVEQLNIVGGIAQVKLSEEYEQIEGSCAKRLAARQVLKTLLEFETVSDVKIE